MNKKDIFIQIACLLDRLEDSELGELCKVNDHDPMRERQHLDSMLNEPYIRCQLPKIISSSGKVLTVQPNWASGYERHTYLFEHVVIDLLKARKNQTKTA